MRKFVELQEDLILLGLAEAKKQEEFVDIGDGYRVPLASMKKYINLTKAVKAHTGKMAEELDRQRDSLHQDMADGAVREQGLDPETSEEWSNVMSLISDYVAEHFKHLNLKESLGAVTASDINLLRKYRPDIESERGSFSGQEQLYRNLEKSYMRRHGGPVLDLPEVPSKLLPLVDKAIAGKSLTAVQGDKIKRTVQAIRGFVRETTALGSAPVKEPVPF